MPVIPKVFLDANVVIQAGKPPGGPLIRRICDLVQSARIKVLTTDLTIIEVAKKHAPNDFTPITDLCRRHVRQLVYEHLDVKIPEKSRDDLHDGNPTDIKAFNFEGEDFLSVSITRDDY